VGDQAIKPILELAAVELLRVLVKSLRVESSSVGLEGPDGIDKRLDRLLWE
jgi:hypothetical protein